MSERHSYQPSDEHRFVVSSDPKSQKRWQAVTSLRRSLTAHLPFFTEAVLSGSLAKGRDLTGADNLDADIDLHIFLNERKTKQGQRAYVHQNSDLFGFGSTHFIPHDFASPLLGALVPLNKPLSAQACLTQNTRLVVAENIRAALKIHFVRQSGDLYALMHRDRPIVHIDTQVFLIAQEGKESPFQALWSTLRGVKRHQVYDEADLTKLAVFLGMELGNGLLPYRQHFFAQLERHSQGSVLWQELTEQIVDRERAGKIPVGLKSEFPDTLKEAKAYYLRRSCTLEQP